MQPRRVIFPDSMPVVHAAIRAALPDAVVVAKRPSRIDEGVTVVQYANASGPDRGLFKDERYGVNCWAPTLREAFESLRIVQAYFKSNVANVPPVISALGGAGPFEVVDEPDAFDSHSHAYCMVELTLRGSNY